MSLTLHYHPLASYCHKVLIALYEHDVEFDKHLVDLGNAQDRAELTALWPLCKFPVLSDSQRQQHIAEASIIIEYLDEYFPSRQRLIPGDFTTALAVRLWDRVFDNYVHEPMQQIVIDRIRNAQGDLSSARSTLDTAYRMIDKQLTDRTWIASDEFSLADCAAVPALFYASTLQAFPQDCKRLIDYFERLIARPSVGRVLEEAKPYFSMYPFKDSLPARFL
ncbi:MAG: glutathione S-transferase family protein [Steroidobacteraceae bacterium]